MFILTGAAYLGILFELIGYILVIGALGKADIRGGTAPPASPYGVEQTYFTPGEPVLNQARFCRECGARNDPGAMFCTQCGRNM